MQDFHRSLIADFAKFSRTYAKFLSPKERIGTRL